MNQIEIRVGDSGTMRDGEVLLNGASLERVLSIQFGVILPGAPVEMRLTMMVQDITIHPITPEIKWRPEEVE